MYLFVNTISKIGKLIIFNEERDIIKEKDFEIKWNESSKLIPEIDSFLKENGIVYKDLKNIVIVNGPWSFTWVRTTVLAINTINFITKNSLTDLNYFDLFDNYPIIKESSKRDCFLKKDKNSPIEIISNDEILKYINENKIEKIYWETNLEGLNTIEKIDYNSIIKNVKLLNKDKVDPLYIKKPNIC